MPGTTWKELLTRTGCLADGQFACPPDMREVTIIVSQYGGGVSLFLSRTARLPGEWTYTDDFIVHRDSAGHTAYYTWDGVVAVFTNPL